MKSYVSLSLDGVKHVYIMIKNIKYLMKIFFIEPFDRDFILFSTFVRILKSTIMCHLKCRSIKFEIRLWRLLRSLGDPKHIGLGMNNKKKILMKKIFFSQFFDRNLTFFRWFWRSLEYLYCLLGVYYCPKYVYGSLSQSLLDVKRVRIGIKKIKNFWWKNFFHQNFWLKFDISPWGSCEKRWSHANFKCFKKNLKHFLKNLLPQFCRAWSGEQIKYPQHGHISWIES